MEWLTVGIVRLWLSKVLLLSLFLVNFQGLGQEQQYLGGLYSKRSYTHDNHSFYLYDFSRKKDSVQIKVKYFEGNALAKYQAWKKDKMVLLTTSANYNNSWEKLSPVGLCVNNGVILNRSAARNMDGLVMIYNKQNPQQGGMAVVDVSKSNVNVENPIGSKVFSELSPIASSLDTHTFLDWASDNDITVFQTHMVYSSKKTPKENFGNLSNGSIRERRYLALGIKEGVVHHLIVDLPTPEYLVYGAKKTKEVLEHDGFEVLYILNLETGSLNTLHAFDRGTLVNLKADVNIKAENLTSRLVWYIDAP